MTHNLFDLRYQPTQKCLDMIRAVSRNVKLSSLIQCLGDRRKPDWPHVVTPLTGMDELPRALGRFPRLHSIHHWRYPSAVELGTRLDEVTALFAEWLIIAAAAVSATPSEDRLWSVGLELVPFDFLCRWPVQSLEWEQCISNITFIDIDIDPEYYMTSHKDGGALKAMLASATGLEAIRLEYKDPEHPSNGTIENFLSDCVANQHWANLTSCALGFRIEEGILLPILERHAKTIIDIEIYNEPWTCAQNTILLLDGIKNLLNLERASVILPEHFDAMMSCGNDACDCQSRLASFLIQHHNEDRHFDIGNYLLDGDCTYDHESETWWRKRLPSQPIDETGEEASAESSEADE